jgi:hypothetical protein
VKRPFRGWCHAGAIPEAISIDAFDDRLSKPATLEIVNKIGLDPGSLPTHCPHFENTTKEHSQ